MVCWDYQYLDSMILIMQEATTVTGQELIKFTEKITNQLL